MKLEMILSPHLRNRKKNYILPKTVGGSRVHLLLGVKNTRIQPVLLRVLSSGVGVYLSHFKDVWDSRIIFAGPSKSFTLANMEQQRNTIHSVYSVEEIYAKLILLESLGLNLLIR